jgi:predicted glycoside hydrolase/deacetylase ChbG (UPF0249 family)
MCALERVGKYPQGTSATVAHIAKEPSVHRGGSAWQAVSPVGLASTLCVTGELSCSDPPAGCDAPLGYRPLDERFLRVLICDRIRGRSNYPVRCASGAVSAEALLIVNADDWGGFREGTDSIEMCFVEGAISSSTAMVHMADADRAAGLAREHCRPIGLHLNFTQPFDGLDVPPSVRERQRRVCAYFSSLGLRRWTYNPDPRVRHLIADCVRDQLESFRKTYAMEPTHLDSHHHVHVCPDVFFSGAIEKGTRVRQTLSRAPTARLGLNGVARQVKHDLLARRFVTTERFWRVRELSGADHSVPIAMAVELARSRSIEVMVHPSFGDELRALRSDAWLDVVTRAPLGAYSAL